MAIGCGIRNRHGHQTSGGSSPTDEALVVASATALRRLTSTAAAATTTELAITGRVKSVNENEPPRAVPA